MSTDQKMGIIIVDTLKTKIITCSDLLYDVVKKHMRENDYAIVGGWYYEYEAEYEEMEKGYRKTGRVHINVHHKSNPMASERPDETIMVSDLKKHLTQRNIKTTPLFPMSKKRITDGTGDNQE